MTRIPTVGQALTVNRGTLRERVAIVVEVCHTPNGILVTYHVSGEGFKAYFHGEAI